MYKYNQMYEFFMSTDCQIYLDSVLPKLTDEAATSQLLECCGQSRFTTCDANRNIIGIQIVNFPLLTGFIPPEIGQLTNLQSLRLSQNSLTGNIPPEMGNLRQLQTLDLSSNSLQGRVPVQLAQCTLLETLQLQRNQLQGLIPDQLMRLPRLRNVNADSGVLPNGPRQVPTNPPPQQPPQRPLPPQQGPQQPPVPNQPIPPTQPTVIQQQPIPASTRVVANTFAPRATNVGTAPSTPTTTSNAIQIAFNMFPMLAVFIL
jgi:hypothetical protein